MYYLSTIKITKEHNACEEKHVSTKQQIKFTKMLTSWFGRLRLKSSNIVGIALSFSTVLKGLWMTITIIFNTPLIKC